MTLALRPKGSDRHSVIPVCGHPTKGQRAMAVARICFETKQRVREVAKHASLSAARVAYASTVIQFAPDLADSVLSGATSLDTAYITAQQRKQASESTEARLAPAHHRGFQAPLASYRLQRGSS